MAVGQGEHYNSVISLFPLTKRSHRVSRKRKYPAQQLIKKGRSCQVVEMNVIMSRYACLKNNQLYVMGL